MAISQVQTPFRQIGSGSASYNSAYPTNPVAHSLLRLEITLDDDASAATNIASITDTAGNAWVYGGSSNASGLPERKHLYYVKDSIAGATTVTVALNSAMKCFRTLHEDTGHDLTNPLVVCDGFNGTTSKPAGTTSVSIPANSLMMGGAISSGTIVATAGWTEVYNAGSNWTEQEQQLFDSGAAGVQTVNWDAASSNSTWAAFIAAFKAAGGGGGGSPETLFVPQVRRVRRWLRR